jgi:hypothetical protein
MVIARQGLRRLKAHQHMCYSLAHWAICKPDRQEKRADRDSQAPEQLQGQRDTQNSQHKHDVPEPATLSITPHPDDIVPTEV